MSRRTICIVPGFDSEPVPSLHTLPRYSLRGEGEKTEPSLRDRSFAVLKQSLVLFMLVAPAVAQPCVASDAVTALPGYHVYRSQLNELIRGEATAESSAQRAAAIRQMAALYSQLIQDPRLATSPTLQRYKTRLWGRLRYIQADLRRAVARQERLGEDAPVGHEQDALADVVERSLSLAAYASGGPARVWLEREATMFGGGAVANEGRDLIELIQRTIDPAFWDVNGGPGTVYYYAPLKVLVVRATSEIHHDLGGSLRQLREAGK